jgi:hypothetical protein
VACAGEWKAAAEQHGVDDPSLQGDGHQYLSNNDFELGKMYALIFIVGFLKPFFKVALSHL